VQLRELYRDVSVTLPGAADLAASAAAARDFVTVEERHAATITPVASSSLTDLTYSIVDTLKLRRQPLVKLRQADGETFWVECDDLAANSWSLNMHEQPERFAHKAEAAYRDFAAPPEQPLLVVDSPEPVSLLVNLGVAAQLDIERGLPPPPTLLVVTGTAAAGKSALIARLAAAMPERLVFPNVVATGVLPWGDRLDIISESDFAAHAAHGRFVYHAAADFGDCVPRHAGCEGAVLRWGVMRDEVASLAAGKKGAFAVVEEHPVGAAAAKAADAGCVVVRVTLPDVDTLDQRLRLSQKQYEEQQVRAAHCGRFRCAGHRMTS
jgi:hypothetical protein